MKFKQSIIEFDVVNKFEKTITTVNELRTGIFAPIDKISANSKTYKDFISNNRKRTIETSWGKTIIKGNILTQTHRDLLDCIIVLMPANHVKSQTRFLILSKVP